MPTLDPHSFFDATQPLTRHLRLTLAVDFERRLVSGEGRARFAAAASGPLDLDRGASHRCRGPPKRRERALGDRGRGGRPRTTPSRARATCGSRSPSISSGES